MEQTETVIDELADVDQTETVIDELADVEQTETVIDELADVEQHELTEHAFDDVLPSVNVQTESVLEAVGQFETVAHELAIVQTEEVGHGQVQKLRGPSEVGKKTKSINKLCVVEPSSKRRRRNRVVERSKRNRVGII